MFRRRVSSPNRSVSAGTLSSAPRHRAVFAAVLASAFSVLVGCKDAVEQELPSRSSRFGILDEFVVFDAPAAFGGAFFVDRFETTVADWREYLSETGTSPESFLDWNEGVDATEPVRGTSLKEARAYARWRFGHLPTLSSWRAVAGGGAGYRFPWGEVEENGFAATAELGRVRPLPVGTFASGAVGGVFDLIGNAGEWTESVESESRLFSDHVLDPERRRRLATAMCRGFWPLPRAILTFVDPDDVKRAVVPGLERRLRDSGVAARPSWKWPDERSDRIGVRVFSSPLVLLSQFDAHEEPLTEMERRAIERFCARPDVAPVLRRTVRDRPALLSSDFELASLLRELLGPGVIE